MAEVIAAPSVRALAQRKGIDIEQRAQALGRTTIAREDLEDAGAGAGAGAAEGAAPGTAPWQVDHAAWGPVRTEERSRFARVTAANLAAAQAHIPAVTHHDRADMTAIDALLRDWAAEAKARGLRLTALAFHVAALARGLRAFPRFNAALSADGATLVLREYVHIGIAVDAPHGLSVPVIRDADRKGLWALAAEIADLAARARDRRIRPDEIGGASMTITNLGGIGGQGFTPIVNPPEVAILGLTRTTTEPWWDGIAFRPVPMAPLDLSYDHRVVNGAEAARFLAAHAAMLADPRRMLV